MGRIGASAWSAAKQYAGTFGRAIFRAYNYMSFGLAERALKFLTRACGCFEAGTPVWTARGRVPIEQIQDGDLVFARDVETGDTTLQRVLSTFTRGAAPLVLVAVVSTNGQQVFQTSEEHPFYSLEWGWVEAGSLEPGEHVETVLGEALVESVTSTGTRTTVYNMEVESLHDYFVGDDGVLVHNGKACHLFEFHHFYPKQLWPQFQKWFSKEELESIGAQLGRDWYKRIHRKGTGLASARNNRWKEWLKTHGNATR